MKEGIPHESAEERVVTPPPIPDEVLDQRVEDLTHEAELVEEESEKDLEEKKKLFSQDVSTIMRVAGVGLEEDFDFFSPELDDETRQGYVDTCINYDPTFYVRQRDFLKEKLNQRQAERLAEYFFAVPDEYPTFSETFPELKTRVSPEFLQEFVQKNHPGDYQFYIKYRDLLGGKLEQKQIEEIVFGFLTHVKYGSGESYPTFFETFPELKTGATREVIQRTLDGIESYPEYIDYPKFFYVFKFFSTEPELFSICFDILKKDRPEAILNFPEFFEDNLMSLPEEERVEMIKRFIEGNYLKIAGIGTLGDLISMGALTPELIKLVEDKMPYEALSYFDSQVVLNKDEFRDFIVRLLKNEIIPSDSVFALGILEQLQKKEIDLSEDELVILIQKFNQVLEKYYSSEKVFSSYIEFLKQYKNTLSLLPKTLTQELAINMFHGGSMSQEHFFELLDLGMVTPEVVDALIERYPEEVLFKMKLHEQIHLTKEQIQRAFGGSVRSDKFYKVEKALELVSSLDIKVAGDDLKNFLEMISRESDYSVSRGSVFEFLKSHKTEILDLPDGGREAVEKLLEKFADSSQIMELLELGIVTREMIDALVKRNSYYVFIKIGLHEKYDFSNDQIHDALVENIKKNAWNIQSLISFAEQKKVHFSGEELEGILHAFLSNPHSQNASIFVSLRRLALLGETSDRFQKLMDIAETIMSSPSTSLRRISSELLGALRDAPDPEKMFAEVEGIFERNQLPLVGKVYKVFEALCPRKTLEAKLKNSNLSPTLSAEHHRSRMYTFYKDLISIHLDSGNPSLLGYLEVLQEGEQMMKKIDAGGTEALSLEEQKSFNSIMGKLKRLYEISLLGKSQTEDGLTDRADSGEVYQNFRESFGVQEGQSLTERLSEMFLKPIGVHSFEEALNRAREKKFEADQRNREFVKKCGNNYVLKEGDLLKGVGSSYLRNIMENGSVAKEFLGASSDSDSTPFDTDVAMVLAEDEKKSFFQTMNDSPASGYGDISLILRERGQFQKTSSEDDPVLLRSEARKRGSKLELFYTGVVGLRHYGIRTGFASTEIDAFVISKQTTREFDVCVTNIITHGYYIPVLDREGRILFTPEEFDEQKKRVLSGLEGNTYATKESSLEKVPFHRKKIDGIIQEKRADKEILEEMNTSIRQAIVEELQAEGIETSLRFNEILSSSEIYDTGSTSRDTNMPQNYDFDFIVKLNARDIEKVQKINGALVKRFGGTLHPGHRTEQLRVLGAEIGGGKVDIDVGFVKKSEVQVYESHDAVKDRLQTILHDLGEVAYERVIGNIIYAKKILKEGEAYKKMEQGGMGGIGVENWILAEGGSVLSAMESFEKKAYKEGQLRSFEDFKREYKIYDPGINAKTDNHDNFVENLTEAGYSNMARVIKEYLDKMRSMVQRS